MQCTKCKDKNVLIECGCGCGRIILRNDGHGHIRRFYFNHQSRKKGIFECDRCADKNWLIECACGCGGVITKRHNHGSHYRTTINSHRLKGELSRHWKGGKRIAKDSGYVLVRKPNHPRQTKTGYVREHILIMEEYLGRYLTKCEVVHHKNGNRRDNRLENLELYASHSEHMKHHSIKRVN